MEELSPREAQRIQRSHLTVKQITERLGNICPRGSFRQNAGECGVLFLTEKYKIHGRETAFYPPEVVETLKNYIERKRAGVNHGKQA